MIKIELSGIEKDVLCSGINEWGGPASCSDELAMAMGFTSRSDIHAETPRLIDAIRNTSTLESRDWARVLVATEFVYASDVFGSGLDWRSTTGISDADTIEILRGLQRKLLKVVGLRHHFGPSAHQEHRRQASLATAMRFYSAERITLDQLLETVESTISSLGRTLSEVEQLRIDLVASKSKNQEQQRVKAIEAIDKTRTAKGLDDPVYMKEFRRQFRGFRSSGANG